jgi:hypothetical protein
MKNKNNISEFKNTPACMNSILPTKRRALIYIRKANFLGEVFEFFFEDSQGVKQLCVLNQLSLQEGAQLFFLNAEQGFSKANKKPQDISTFFFWLCGFEVGLVTHH